MPASPAAPWRWPLHWQILTALVLGLALGLALPADGRVGPVDGVAVLGFLGDLFLRALKMVIVPLLAGSIITGVAGLGDARALGRLFRRTFTWYMLTSLIAILIGLALVNAIRPGVADGVPVGQTLGLAADVSGLDDELSGRGAADLVGIVLRMIPTNPLQAAAEGQMLPLIVFCMLFGTALTLLDEPLRGTQLRFWDGLFQVMMRITGWVIRFTPLGVLGLIGRIAATSGLEAFAPLLKFALTVVLGLGLHALVVLPLLLRLGARVPPLRHARAMAPALMTAFTTRSSSATLPLTMECVEHRAGVSNRVTSFVLPLGATVNMDGTALYECVCALFIAQAYGIALGPVDQFVVVVTALLASIGAAGIPSAGLVMIAIVLGTVGLPLEGVALILAVDPLLDMLRTCVNIFSDSCGAVVVARREGETDFYPDSGA
ncbi:MAG TPA: dicarboxylate/amino acid:cation symporter [Candidatus Krumholzibacteria bacterium]|nr:dicarboxylate/amino acid:cation symporter [Candidatus Krumholzibacteria bacterium]